MITLSFRELSLCIYHIVRLFLNKEIRQAGVCYDRRILHATINIEASIAVEVQIAIDGTQYLR